MSKLPAKILLCAMVISISAIGAHAERSASPHLVPSPRAASHPSAAVPLLGADGLCCRTPGEPVIPLDTPMPEPAVPTAPGMPGQPPAIGTTPSE